MTHGRNRRLAFPLLKLLLLLAVKPGALPAGSFIQSNLL
jgi:hypothetical protein